MATDDTGDGVAVGFGGMRFTGVEDGLLRFQRVRDLWPGERLSPARSWTMTLEPHWVASVHEDGRQGWPTTPAHRRPGCKLTQ